MIAFFPGTDTSLHLIEKRSHKQWHKIAELLFIINLNVCIKIQISIYLKTLMSNSIIPCILKSNI